jgi:hypothetical protein
MSVGKMRNSVSRQARAACATTLRPSREEYRLFRDLSNDGNTFGLGEARNESE